MSRPGAWWLVALLVGLVVIGLVVVPRSNGTAQATLAGTLLTNKTAPGFRLSDQFGRSITLSQFRGRPVVLTFLAAHCKETCPLIADKFHQAVRGLGPAGSEVTYLVVSVDPKGDTAAAVRRFSRAYGMLRRWHYLVGTRRTLARVWRAYYIYAAPPNAPPQIRDAHTSAVYLIDREGRERALLTGDPDERVLQRDLQILLGVPIQSPFQAVPAPEVGHPAPDFRLDALRGPSIYLRALRGKVVLVNFWATWCTPCRTEMPLLARWYRSLRGRRFTIIGVDQQEGRGDVQAFTHRLGIPYPIALDGSGAVSAGYNVIGLPTSFLLDPQGVIRSVHVGMVGPDFESRQIAPLLGDGAHG